MATDDAMDVESSAAFGMEVDRGADRYAQSLQLARRVVVAFMRDRRAEEIVPVNSRVVVIDANITLRQAFRALLQNGVRAAPVIDTSTNAYTSMISVSDIVDTLLHFYFTSPTAIAQGLSENTVSLWYTLHPPAPFQYAPAEATLYDACVQLRDLRIHRLPILSQCGTLLYTLGHRRVLRFLHAQFGGADAHAGRMFTLSISSLAIGTYTAIDTVRDTDSVVSCLQAMKTRNLSAVPVVNERTELVNVFSRTDSAAFVSADVAELLERPVAEVLAECRPFVAATCRREDSLGVVFEKFEQSGRHRLYVVNDAAVVEGVVSLSDLLRYFLDAF